MLPERRSPQMLQSLRKAELSLSFIIVGASVAGLCCAYNLKLAGHNVYVVESSSSLPNGKGGIRIPPNMTRLMLEWGLGPELEKASCGRCPKIVFHSGITAERLGELVFHEEVMKALEADIYLVLYSDLIEMLYKLVTNAGVTVEFDSQVTSVNASQPCVVLQDGRQLVGDIIIGADGDCSAVRPILQKYEGKEETAQLTCCVFTIPASALDNDEELQPLLGNANWNLFMGDRMSLLVHSVRGGAALAVNWFMEEETTESIKGWEHGARPRDLPVDVSHFAPRLQRLIFYARDGIQTRHIIQPPLENWYDDDGHVVLTGDAAHTLNPGSSHSAALAAEDAAMLGSLFSRLRSRDQIKSILSAYQELRQQRCEAVRLSEVEKVLFTTLPPGKKRDERDGHMKRALEAGKKDWTGSSEDYLREQWEEFRDLFGYNAYEEADAWWVDFGNILERLRGRPRDDFISGQVFVEVRADVHQVDVYS